MLELQQPDALHQLRPVVLHIAHCRIDFPGLDLASVGLHQRRGLLWRAAPPIKGDAPEATLLEWVQNNQRGMIENVGLIQMIKFMTNEAQVRRFMDMEWTVHSTAH